jgi:hypothetical protein
MGVLLCERHSEGTFSFYPGDLQFHQSTEMKANIISISFQDTGEISSGKVASPRPLKRRSKVM